MAYIQVSSGRRFRPFEPRIADVNIRDIASSLGKLCRFTGHCKRFYSVAEHSILVSRLMPPGKKLAGLLHDAAEAYVNDVAAPLKPELPDYGCLERGVEQVIAQAFSVEFDDDVKWADRMALSIEVHALMPNPSDFEGLMVPLPGFEIQCLDWYAAEVDFLARYEELVARER